MARLVNETRDTVVANTHDAARWAQLGMVCEANGLLSPARASYLKAVALDQWQPKWEYRLAVVENMLGDPKSAMSRIDLAIQLEPRFSPLHWRRGLWLLDEGHFQEAEAAFRRALEIDPHDRAGRLALARTLLLARRPAESLIEANKVLADHPGDRYALQLVGGAYRQQGHLDEAQKALAAGAEGVAVWSDAWSEELTPYQYAYGTLVDRANRLMAAGAFDEAGRIYQQLYLRRPADLVVANHLAEDYLGSGQVDLAIQLLVTVLQREPDNFQTHVNLASALLNKGQLTSALEHSQRAVELNGRSSLAHQTRALALWKSGHRLTALTSLDAAFALDRRNPTILIWRGLILNEIGNKAPALAAFRSAAEIAPGLIDAWLGIAMMHMQAGAINETEAALDRAAGLNARHPDVVSGFERLRALKAKSSAAVGPTR